MTFLEAYVLFGIPVLALSTAYLAVRWHERSLRRSMPVREIKGSAHPSAPKGTHRNAP